MAKEVQTIGVLTSGGDAPGFCGLGIRVIMGGPFS